MPITNKNNNKKPKTGGNNKSPATNNKKPTRKVIGGAKVETNTPKKTTRTTIIGGRRSYLKKGGVSAYKDELIDEMNRLQLEIDKFEIVINEHKQTKGYEQHLIRELEARTQEYHKILNEWIAKAEAENKNTKGF